MLYVLAYGERELEVCEQVGDGAVASAYLAALWLVSSGGQQPGGWKIK